MIIRLEVAADIDAIRAVHTAAFPEPIEAGLVDALRADMGWMPALSFVALDDDAVVGHVVCTRGTVGATPALGLGPLGVLPDRQRTGVGLALMHAVVGAADALGEPLIALLGNPGYYGRYGFVRSTDVRIDPPEPAWGEHFQVRTLTSYDPALTGTFQYAQPFNELG